MKDWKLPPRGEEYRRRLSESLKAKWRSGTRKQMSKDARDRITATLREGYATGRLKRPKLSKKILARIGRKVSAHHKGKVFRKMPFRDWERKKLRQLAIARRGPGNPREKIWRLRSPDNRVFIFKNLQHFIRTNSDLFLPEDLNTRASKGIQSICPRKKICVGSWKGWTWYSHFEEVKNKGQDLLSRQINGED
jgi:hypothetical protein